MNRKLRFSWAHIVAFLALIFIAYVVFMGATYYTVGNYYAGLITMGFCVLLIVSTILGAQILKGVDKKFHRSVIWERVLIGLSPVIIIIVGIPFSHFWTVQSSETEIKYQFRISITSALDIFSDYDSYSKERISQLETSINSSVKDEQLKKNRVDELTLYLNNSTAKSIETAKAWINKVNEDPSIWNVFLFGNIFNIESAIKQWAESLNTISKKHMSDESYAEPFSTTRMNKELALSNFANLKSIYKEVRLPNATALLTLLLCYLMLLCPYFVQERNAKSIETFFGRDNRNKGISKDNGNANTNINNPPAKTDPF